MEDILDNNLDSKNSDLNDTGSIIFNSKNTSQTSLKKDAESAENKPVKINGEKESIVEKNEKRDKKKISSLLTKVIPNPIWLSVSEAAKIGGVQNKTIRRAIQAKTLKYKVVSNRYLVDLASVIIYLCAKTKLKNKLNQLGIGQYIEKWQE